MTRGVNDGVRRIPMSANRLEEYEVAELIP
jgi:hypothetical protein